MITRNSISSSGCLRLIEKSQKLASTKDVGAGAPDPLTRRQSIGLDQ